VIGSKRDWKNCEHVGRAIRTFPIKRALEDVYLEPNLEPELDKL
jgi:hypothetical protein